MKIGMIPTKQQLIVLAKAAAAKAGLPPNIVCGMVDRESEWDPWAVRYEPAFFNKYVLPIYAQVSPDPKEWARDHMSVTEAKTRSISWGLMQVMGQTARESGFTAQFPSLCDPETGLAIGCAVFAHRLAVAHGDVSRALEAWNGGANPNYAKEVLTLAAQYRPPPIAISA